MLTYLIKKCKCKSSCIFNSEEALECPKFRSSIEFLTNHYAIDESTMKKLFAILDKKK